MSKHCEIEIEVTEKNLENDLKQIIEKVHPEWLDKFGEELKTSTMNGGISNKLYACYPKSIGLDSTETLLVRLYGKDTEKFIDRDEEIATLKTFKAIDLGPKFYCSFLNGICYEYLPGSIVDYKIVTDPVSFPRIAESIASLHLANFKGLRTEEQLDKDEKPFIFNKIAQLIDLIRPDYSKNMSKMTDECLKKTPTLTQLRDELSFLQNQIKK